mgnify:FL=1
MIKYEIIHAKNNTYSYVTDPAVLIETVVNLIIKGGVNGGDVKVNVITDPGEKISTFDKINVRRILIKLNQTIDRVFNSDTDD